MVFWKKKDKEKPEVIVNSEKDKTSTERWKVGDRIEGCYEVYAIKKGGMGIVYLCYDHKTKVPFAIKTFLDIYLTDKRAIERFKWEAETWVKLEKHKNIVQAYYVLNILDRPYIVLEFVSGDEKYGNDLSGWIWNNALGVNTSLNFAIQFCLGMEHAEKKFKESGKPFVHRDIKPGNIMVTQDKVIKITDFGLVRTFSELGRDINVEITRDDVTGAERCDFTVFGNFCGTPVYASPEQFLGKGTVTPSDIYAFGCVLYEMLTGRKPFEGPTFENYMAQHIKSVPLQPKKLIQAIPSGLNELVMRCLRKNPDERYPSFDELREALTKIYVERTGEAIKEETPQELEAWELVNKGISLANLGRLPDAIGYYDMALEINTKDAEAWHCKGNTLVKLGMRQEAIGCYDRALEANPKYSQAYYNKGVNLGELGRPQEAIECYDKALETNPIHAWAWSNKGYILENLGMHPEAIKCYDRALEVNPKLVEAWYNKGVALGGLGRPQEAIECYDRALEANPKYADAWNAKGYALNKLGRAHEAIGCHDKALEANPKYAQAWSNKGSSLVILGMWQEAIGCYDRALEINPKLAQAWCSKGIALGKFGRLQESIECYDNALEANPKLAEAWWFKGNALFKLARDREAIECYDRALDANPKYAQAWYNKGYTLGKLGMLQEAIECYDAALEMNPKYADAWYGKGAACALIERPRSHEAIEAFQNYLKFTPPQMKEQIEKVKEIIRTLGGKI